MWSKGFGDSASQDPTHIAFDPQENALVTGWFQGSVDFGGGPLIATSGGLDAFVAKFAP